MDLTKIETPFGLLDDETREALKAHEAAGGKIQRFFNSGWHMLASSGWIDSLTYRAAPAPLRKPSIDWSHVSDDFNFLASDENGDTYLYERKPSQFNDRLWGEGGNITSANHFASYTPGDCDWRDSLVMRPGYEGDDQ